MSASEEIMPVCDGAAAHLMHADRLARPRKLIKHPELCNRGVERIKNGWMPEQIDDRMIHEGAPLRVWQVTIHRYTSSKEGQRDDLWWSLATYRVTRRSCRTRRRSEPKFHREVSILLGSDDVAHRRQSDQDNCLILSDDVTDAQMPWFAECAKFVSDGLDTCGYFYCPGDVMASNPRWCQPLRVWRGSFQSWISRPNPEAQMLAWVMFDLRPIGGEETLFESLRQFTLQAASETSIFVAHMISNALTHQPLLGLLRGLATIRLGEHRSRPDLKHNGVVPVADLGRAYALQGQLIPVNTRSGLVGAIDAAVISKTGARICCMPMI